LQLHHVISDITGATGLAIVDAILAGQRDPEKLAELRNRQIKASRETVIQSLIGDYRAEHIFVLRQSLTAYRQYQTWITECDRDIEKQLETLETKVEPAEKPLAKSKDRHKPRRNEARFDLRNHLYRVFGVDLTAVPGISSLTAQVLLTEVGTDLTKFSTASAFASWLGLCPD